jgi:hypothetical protein
MLFCGLKPYEALAINVALDPNPKSELGSMDRSAKNILIFRPSPNQQSRVIADSGHQVDLGYGDGRRVHALVRSDKAVEGLGIRLIAEIKRVNRLLAQIDGKMADFGDEPSRSSASSIFPRDLNIPPRFLSVWY